MPSTDLLKQFGLSAIHLRIGRLRRPCWIARPCIYIRTCRGFLRRVCLMVVVAFHKITLNASHGKIFLCTQSIIIGVANVQWRTALLADARVSVVENNPDRSRPAGLEDDMYTRLCPGFK
eukprot:jgi/Botrbrau1/10873/Bobra.0025s0050.1